jgi:hypothetical protein
MLLQIDHESRTAVVGAHGGAAGWRALASWGRFAATARILAGAWRQDHRLMAMAAALLAAHVIFFLLFYVHGLAQAGGWASETWQDYRLGFLHPGSYPKGFSFGEAGAASILFIAAYARLRQPVYAAAALVLFAVLLDMTIGVHRHIGWAVARLLDLVALGGIGPVQRLGEAVGMAAGGAGIAVLLIMSAARSRPGHAQVGLILLVALGGLGLFAAGFEMFLSLAVPLHSPAYLPIKLAEEIGEMVMLGAIAVLAAVLAVHGDRLGSSRVSGPA